MTKNSTGINYNINRTFSIILDSDGCSRVSIASKLGLSKPVVSSMVDGLIKDNFVREGNYEDRNHVAGRKAIQLYPQEQLHFIVVVIWKENSVSLMAVDIGSNERVCPINFDITVGMSENRDSNLGSELISYTQKGIRIINDVVGEKRILAICIVLQGMIDPSRETFISTPLQIERNEGTEIIKRLKQVFANKLLGIFVDTACLGYGEMVLHSRWNEKFAFVNMGDGIGASLVLKGEILGGASGSTTQFGHICVHQNGPLCRCGARGCLEACIGEHSLFDRYSSQISCEDEKCNNLTYEQLGKLAAEGSGWAIEAINELADDFTIALRNLIAIAAPEYIIVGGHGINLGDIFLQRVKSHLHQMDFLFMADRVHIQYATEDKQTLLCTGAVRYMIDHYVNLSSPAPGVFLQ